MNTCPPKNNNNWQLERSRILQRGCRRIKRAIEAGKPIARTIRRISRQLNGKHFHCDPTRTLALSENSLRRLWDVWRKSGEVPSAFKLNYYSCPSAMTSPVLIAFVDFCATSHHRSMRQAWLKFLSRPKTARLAHEFKGMTLTYDMLVHNLPAENFYQLRDRFDAIGSAERELNQLRLKITADIRNRFPARRPRRRVAPGNNFSI